ncbi:zinc ribbon domain-containing protein [Streptococcaceae bacterium ESL0729]|nr:zinc ribbon domain-containing protein [Streptococcaceae bacterium ESL0729]
MEDNLQTNCKNCKAPLAPDDKFCPSCGHPVEGTIKSSTSNDKIKDLKPSKLNMHYLKNFLINNFELTHTFYGLIFFITLFSAQRGLIFLLLSLMVLYFLAISSKGNEIKANRKLIELFSKTYSQSETTIQSIHSESAKIVGELTKTVDSDQAKDKVDNPAPAVSNNLTKLGLVNILTIISSLLALYGALGPKFIKFIDENIYQLLGDISSVGRSINGFNQMFGNGQTNNSLELAKYIGFALIIVPILTIVFTFLANKALQMTSLILAALELILFIALGSYLSSTLNNFGYHDGILTLLFNKNYPILGFPAYALLFGTIGMVISSALKFFKSKNK